MPAGRPRLLSAHLRIVPIALPWAAVFASLLARVEEPARRARRAPFSEALRVPPLIAEETIDRVRREARIVAIVGERVKLTLRGRLAHGALSFSQGKDAELPRQRGAGLLSLLRLLGVGRLDQVPARRSFDGLSFVDAVRYIAERQGIEIVETGSDAERREQSEIRKRRDELYTVGETAAQYFEKMLLTHPLGRAAVKELERRGLDARAPSGPMADALKAFRIGYAPYGWDGFARHVR